MMIQIDHRESRDVDLFPDDPQLLSYVEAVVAEMQFALGEANYNGDGFGHLKIAFDGIGEIDFIVTDHITDVPTTNQGIEGRPVALETVPEIIAKKVLYRGSRVQPRDRHLRYSRCHRSWTGRCNPCRTRHHSGICRQNCGPD